MKVSFGLRCRVHPANVVFEFVFGGEGLLTLVVGAVEAAAVGPLARVLVHVADHGVLVLELERADIAGVDLLFHVDLQKNKKSKPDEYYAERSVSGK